MTVKVLTSIGATAREIPVWIDTGFTGEIVLPQHQINELSLSHSGTVKAVLADGSEVALKTFACQIDWFDRRRDLEVIANDSQYPLLGVGLLLGRNLNISYRSGEIRIN